MAQKTSKSDVAVASPAILKYLDILIDRKIRSFLAGDTDGTLMLGALYGDTIDEPVPARLTALMRHRSRSTARRRAAVSRP